jgi:hypothetical protein
MPRKPIPAQTHRVTAVELDDWVNPETGEVKRVLEWQVPVEETQTRGRPRRGTNPQRRTNKQRSKKVASGYVMVDTESFGMLDLSRQEYRVFSFLLSKVDGAGEIRVTNQYISKAIGMTSNNVSRTMKSLRERDIVISEGYGVWRINAWIAWVGEWKKWNKASQDDPEPTWSTEETPELAVVE